MQKEYPEQLQQLMRIQEKEHLILREQHIMRKIARAPI